MAKINQVYQIINQVQKQAWGTVPVELTNATTLIALGDYLRNDATPDSRDIFTGKLSEVIGKTILVSRPFTANSLGISRDEMEWGGVVRKVRVKPKLVEHNTEYDLNNTSDFNPFDIVTPEVDQKLFSKFGTFESLVTVTDEQLFTAFTSEGELLAFYELIYKTLEDSMKRGMLSYDRMALVNFMAEKFKLQTLQGNKTHTVNLLAQYKTETGDNNITAAQALAGTHKEFNRFLASTMLMYKGWMAEDTDVFNASEGYTSQTTENYLNFYILRNISSRLPAYLYSSEYHDEMVKINNYTEVNFWQGIGDVNGFNVNSTSKIHVNTASDATEIEQAGIIAVMIDKDAVATYYKRDKAESWRVPTKGTNHYKATTQMMANDMWENGIVFYVED